LQATNAGEKRPGYEAKVRLPQFVFYLLDFFSGSVDFFSGSVVFFSGSVDFTCTVVCVNVAEYVYVDRCCKK